MHTPVNRSVEEKHMQQISVPLSATIVLGGDNRKAPSIWESSRMFQKIRS